MKSDALIPESPCLTQTPSSPEAKLVGSLLLCTHTLWWWRHPSKVSSFSVHNTSLAPVSWLSLIRLSCFDSSHFRMRDFCFTVILIILITEKVLIYTDDQITPGTRMVLIARCGNSSQQKQLGKQEASFPIFGIKVQTHYSTYGFLSQLHTSTSEIIWHGGTAMTIVKKHWHHSYNHKYKSTTAKRPTLQNHTLTWLPYLFFS